MGEGGDKEEGGDDEHASAGEFGLEGCRDGGRELGRTLRRNCGGELDNSQSRFFLFC